MYEDLTITFHSLRDAYRDGDLSEGDIDEAEAELTTCFRDYQLEVEHKIECMEKEVAWEMKNYFNELKEDL